VPYKYTKIFLQIFYVGGKGGRVGGYVEHNAPRVRAFKK